MKNHTAPRAAARKRLRRAVNKAGGATCSNCGGNFPADHIEIDHRTRLVDGGTDTDDNVQPLCTTCHNTKSADERAAQRPTPWIG